MLTKYLMSRNRCREQHRGQCRPNEGKWTRLQTHWLLSRETAIFFKAAFRYQSAPASFHLGILEEPARVYHLASRGQFEELLSRLLDCTIAERHIGLKEVSLECPISRPSREKRLTPRPDVIDASLNKTLRLESARTKHEKSL